MVWLWQRKHRPPPTTTVRPYSPNSVLWLLSGHPSTVTDGELATYLATPNSGGLSCRLHWHDIETTNGVYNWSSFDRVVNAAVAAHKTVMVRALPGVFTPTWVYAAGAVSHSYGGETAPLPWDAVYLQYLERFVWAFGRRYADVEAVRIVAVTGPSDGGEMYLLDKMNAAYWLGAGYTRAKLVNAWRHMITVYGAAFPRQLKTLALSLPCAAAIDDSQALVEEILAASESYYLGYQGNWLAAKTAASWWPFIKITGCRMPAGFQMLCGSDDAVRFGGTLLQAFQKAVQARATFLEVYPTELATNPTIAADLAWVAPRLRTS